MPFLHWLQLFTWEQNSKCCQKFSFWYKILIFAKHHLPWLQNFVIFLKFSLARICKYVFTVPFPVLVHCRLNFWLKTKQICEVHLCRTVWRCSVTSLVSIEQKLWEEIGLISFTDFEKNRAMDFIICNRFKSSFSIGATFWWKLQICSAYGWFVVNFQNFEL